MATFEAKMYDLYKDEPQCDVIYTYLQFINGKKCWVSNHGGHNPRHKLSSYISIWEPNANLPFTLPGAIHTNEIGVDASLIDRTLMDQSHIQKLNMAISYAKGKIEVGEIFDSVQVSQEESDYI